MKAYRKATRAVVLAALLCGSACSAVLWIWSHAGLAEKGPFGDCVWHTSWQHEPDSGTTCWLSPGLVQVLYYRRIDADHYEGDADLSLVGFELNKRVLYGSGMPLCGLSTSEPTAGLRTCHARLRLWLPFALFAVYPVMIIVLRGGAQRRLMTKWNAPINMSFRK